MECSGIAITEMAEEIHLNDIEESLEKEFKKSKFLRDKKIGIIK